ncbi:MAG: aminopeptidase [Clostridia bacterium]|nr:aminopeptidase [Clostridia bacterium]
MKTLEQMKREYAEVLIKIGVALKEGQKLVVECPVEHADFMPILAEVAYENKCGGLVTLYVNEKVERISAEKLVENYEDPMKPVSDYYAEQGAASIRLTSPNLKAMEGMAPEAVKAYTTAVIGRRRGFKKIAGESGGTIACLPGKAWAELVFPEIEDEAERINAMWDIVLSCVRCKEENPIEAWQNFMARTGERKKKLDEKKFIEFRYKSDKSDFTVEPAEGSVWMGGCVETPNRVYVPNIPTEEVFQTPHKYKVNGVIGAVMPLVYSGQLIEDIKLELKDGRIVNYSASRGEDVLKTIIETDEGSHYLGEMAFIDVSSPISSQGRVFYTTLYDENASCHMAIGNSYAPPMSDEEMEAKGYNKSGVHVDFMIGDDSMDIDGKTQDGTWEPIFRKGHWAI